MKKFLLLMLSLFILLFLISCSEEEQTEERFRFAGEIDKIIVTGKGIKHDLATRTIDKEVEINIIREAMKNAGVFLGKRTNEGSLFELEIIFKDDSRQFVDLWYYPSTETGLFYTDKNYYSMNDSGVPELIELFESFQ